jgi:hypothetical protein
MNLATEAKKPIIISSMTAASSRFKGLRPELEQQVRKTDVQTDQMQETLCSKWKEFKGLSRYDWDDYPKAVKILDGVDATPKDVETFSLALSQFEGENCFHRKAGLFLSALMNQSSHDGFIIHVSHLKENLDFLGYRNEKRVTIKGNAGHHTGENMKKGSILVEGSSGIMTCYAMESGYVHIMGSVDSGSAGRIAGGAFIVDGDAASNNQYALADEMSGGVVWIKGGSGSNPGQGMKGGILIIEGDVSSMLGSHLHKGATIVAKGNAGNGIGYMMESGRIYLTSDYGNIWDHDEKRLHWTTGGMSWYASHDTTGMIFHKGILAMASHWDRFWHNLGTIVRQHEPDPQKKALAMIEAAKKGAGQ